MNEKSYVRTLLSKKIFWVTLGCFLITALIVGVVIQQKMYLKEKHLREKYIESQPRDMIIRIETGGTWIPFGPDDFYSVNTEFHHKTEIDESTYEEAKARIGGGIEEKDWEKKVLEENNISFFEYEEVVFINDFIYYALGDWESGLEFFRFNTITKSSERINYDNDISIVDMEHIRTIEAAVFSLYPNIINEIEYVISQNPPKSRFEYSDVFISNGHILFQIVEPYISARSSMTFKLYEYLPEQEEAVFLIDTGDDEVAEVIFLE